MNPVLIYTDTGQIVSDKATLNNTVPLFQTIYNVLKALGIAATLQEITYMVNLTVNGNGSAEFEYEYVINKLLDVAPYNLNGVQLQRSKVRDMIVQPDITALKAALAEARNTFSTRSRSPLSDLLTLVNDVISKVANADTTIESRNTYYSKTDASAALATSLQGICDILNTHDSTYNNVVATGLQEKNTVSTGAYDRSFGNQTNTVVPGVAIVGTQFVPSLTYIQRFESMQAA